MDGTGHLLSLKVMRVSVRCRRLNFRIVNIEVILWIPEAFIGQCLGAFLLKFSFVLCAFHRIYHVIAREGPPAGAPEDSS